MRHFNSAFLSVERKVAVPQIGWDKPINNLAKLGCGALLLLAPWLFDFASESIASWNTWLSGCAVIASASMALVTKANWERETSLVLGIWLVIAPSVLGFPNQTSAVLAHICIGFALAAFAVSESEFSRGTRSKFMD